METLFSLVALVLAVIALSKHSKADYRIYKLERKVEELSKALKPESKTESMPARQNIPAQNEDNVNSRPVLQPSAAAVNTVTAEPSPEHKYTEMPPQENSYTEMPAFTGEDYTAPAQENQPPFKQDEMPSLQAEHKPLSIAQIFSWIGGVLIVLGALFTFFYMFQNGIITLGMVFCFAAVAGFLLTAAGMVMKNQSTQTTAATLCAAGVSICFITAFCAHKFGYLSVSGAFAFMVVTAFGSFFVSLYKEKQFIALLALIAAFLTPVILSSGENKYIFFFTYLLIVNIPAAAIALKKGWGGLAYTAMVLTLLCEFSYITGTHSGPYLFVILLVYALCACSCCLLDKEKYSPAVTDAMGIFAALQTAILAFAVVGKSVNQANIYYVFGAVLIIDIALYLFHIKRQDKAAGVYIVLAFTLLCQIFGALSGKAEIHFFLVPLVFGLAALGAGLVDKDKTGKTVFTVTGIFIAANIFVLGLCSFMKGSYDIIPLYFGSALFVTAAAFAFEALHNTKAVNITALICWVFFYLFFTVQHFYARPCVGYGVLAVFAVFYAFPFICKDKFKDGGVQWLCVAGISVAAFFPVYFSVGKAYFAATLAVVPLFFALCYLLPVVSYFKNNKDLAKTKAIFTAFGIIFTALVFPVQFSGKLLTVLLSCYAAALCWLDNKIENKAVMPMAWLVFGAVFARLALNPFVFDYCASQTKIFNWYMLVFGTGACAMLVSAKFFLSKHPAFKNVLNICGGILLFYLLNIEIADYFASGKHLSFNVMGNFAEAVTYTIGWAVYGAAACVIALYNKSKVLSKCGIAIICITLIKFALTDIWKLDMLYRIIGLFSLAVLLIAVAFLFQKYNKKEE